MPPAASAHVCQCAVSGAHAGAMGTSGAAMGADPAAAALDTRCPTIGASAMGGGQAAEGHGT